MVRIGEDKVDNQPLLSTGPMRGTKILQTTLSGVLGLTLDPTMLHLHVNPILAMDLDIVHQRHHLLKTGVPLDQAGELAQILARELHRVVGTMQCTAIHSEETPGAQTQTCHMQAGLASGQMGLEAMLDNMVKVKILPLAVAALQVGQRIRQVEQQTVWFKAQTHGEAE